MKITRRNLLVGICALTIALWTVSCDEPSEPDPISPKTQKPDVFQEVGLGDGIAAINPEPNSRLSIESVGNCYKGNRLEFDVYDINPEFVNPKNYQITLEKLDDYVTIATKQSRSFNQYCTQNNTVTFRNLTKGVYLYTLTSDCTAKVYQGKIFYQGGYQANILHIDQGYCD